MQSLPLALLALASLAASVPAQSLATVYTGGNSGTTTWTNQFDITVLNPAGVWITAFEVNCENSRSGPVGSRFTLDIWKTLLGGTYVGNQTNSGAWTKVARGQGISRTQGLPTPVDVSDFFLAPGRHGLALEYNGTAMAYTNGTGSNQRFANADIQLDLGSSTTGLFGSPLYDPRVWNGAVWYFAGNATWRPYGAGCQGTGGVPGLAPAPGSLPKFGTVFKLDLTKLPAAPGPLLTFLGLSTETYAGIPLPLDLTVLGAPGCSLLCSGPFTLPAVNVGGSGLLVVSIPNDPVLLRGRFLLQTFVPDAAANALGLTVTNAGEGYIGK